MAAPSNGSPNSTVENPQTSGAQVVQPDNLNRQDAKVELEKESSPTSVFVNSEPIREDQVRNAVQFLSHPKVKGSPVMYRRSFLERKGLTKEEIDEAFRRVPDPTPAVTTMQSVVSNQDGQAKSVSNVQQPPAQVVQPTPASSSRTGMLSRFHWYHAVFAISFLAASGAGTAVLFKKSILPRLKSWIRKSALEEDEEDLLKQNNAKPSIVEEAAAAAKAAAAAASDVARASQEMLMTKTEEKKCLEELVNALNMQLHEMKSMSGAIQKLENGQNANGMVSVEDWSHQRVTGMNPRQPYVNGSAHTNSQSVRHMSAPAPVQPSVNVSQDSYVEIMDMIQRGENPFNIRDLNNSSPNSQQPVSNPQLATRPQPWEVSQARSSSASQAQLGTNGATSYGTSNSHPNGDAAAPWWQRQNVRITEIEPRDEEKSGPSMSNEQLVRRSWVPPQPPPVVMAEAAAAIRQPKKSSSSQTEQAADTSPANVTDELQRITRISETGSGSGEAIGESFKLDSTEITEE